MDMITNNAHDSLVQDLIALIERINNEGPDEALKEIEESDQIPRIVVALEQIVVQKLVERFDYALYILFELKRDNGLQAAMSLLQDEDPIQRWYACEILSEYGDETVVPELMKAATTDLDTEVRASALLTLANIANQDLLPFLENIRDHDKSVTQKGHSISSISTMAIDLIKKRVGIY